MTTHLSQSRGWFVVLGRRTEAALGFAFGDGQGTRSWPIMRVGRIVARHSQEFEQLRRTDENCVRRMLIKDEEIRRAFPGLLIRQFLIRWLAHHCNNHVPSEGFGE